MVEFTGESIWVWSFFREKVFSHKCNFFNRYKLFRLFLLEWVLIFFVFQGICYACKMLIIFIFLWISVESVVVLFSLFQKLVIYAFFLFLLVSLVRCYQLAMLSQSTSPYFFHIDVLFSVHWLQLRCFNFLYSTSFLFNWLNQIKLWA